MTRRLLFAVALTACAAASEKPICTPAGYRQALNEAYAPYESECNEYERIDDCPGYREWRVKAAVLREEHLRCR